MKRMLQAAAVLVGLGSGALACGAEVPGKVDSHPRLRPAPMAADRPLPKGPSYFVDAARGHDGAEGTPEAPWKTIQHALTRLNAGDTLCLRGGTYYENLYCSVVGTPDKPIVIRSFPGELAVIDGGLREFFDSPADAWQPFDGAPGEFRSSRPLKNLREVTGNFGDSMIGLQTYYYAPDLRGERYCGPGIWYDRLTGYLHARLAHYKAYEGETDPRKLPLVLAGAGAVPLTIDRSEHLRLQDLVIRGGGYNTVLIRYGVDIEFDNVVIYAGTYGLKARNTGPFRFFRSAVYGSIPPWSVRGEAGLEEVPWTKDTKKNLTRLNTHAVFVAEPGFEEWDVYYYPYNSDWEVAYSEFTDGADGLYLGNVDGMKFHHNLVDGFLDDGVYLSHFRPIRKSHGPTHIYQNHFARTHMAFAFGGPGVKGCDIYLYRNIVEGSPFMSDHGSPPWDGMYIYHNTVTSTSLGNVFKARGDPWHVRNNIFVAGKPPAQAPPHATFIGNVAGEAVVAPGFVPAADGGAVDAGEPIPPEWPDPLRELDKGKPDAGAIPAGVEPWPVGRYGTPKPAG